jgi:hypothetical protein
VWPLFCFGMDSPSRSGSNPRLEGLAARLQSIQEGEKEKKDALGKYVINFIQFFSNLQIDL